MFYFHDTVGLLMYYTIHSQQVLYGTYTDNKIKIYECNIYLSNNNNCRGKKSK